MKESDLYPPLKQFLEQRDYEVKAEVKNCDVVAMKPDQPPTIIELKLSLNLKVILQAVDRLLLSPVVYIGVPDSCPTLKKQRKRISKLLKMLGLGLLVINPRYGSVQVRVEPTAYKPRQSKPRGQWLIDEFAALDGDPNLGGAASKSGRMTVYRQQAIEIARYLDKHGPSKPACIAKALDIPKTYNILYNNHYGWFERPAKGIYQLSEPGQKALGGFSRK